MSKKSMFSNLFSNFDRVIILVKILKRFLRSTFEFLGVLSRASANLKNLSICIAKQQNTTKFCIT